MKAHAERVEHIEARQDLIKDGDNPLYVNLILEGWAWRYKQLETGAARSSRSFFPAI